MGFRFDEMDSGPLSGEIAAGFVQGFRLAVTSGDNAMATWLRQTGESYEIRGRIFPPGDGEADPEFIIGTIAGATPSSHPSVTAISANSFAVAWEGDDVDGDGTAIFVQLFGPNGATTEPIVINTFDLDLEPGHWAPSISLLPDGRIGVSWDGDNYTGSRILEADGTVSSVQGGGPPGTHFLSLADGRFLATWTEFEAGPGGPSSTNQLTIRAIFVTADGLPQGSDFVVTSRTTSDATEAFDDQSTITLANGSFVVVYSDGHDIYARSLNSDGTPSGDEALINTNGAGDQESPSAVALADGSYVVTWQSGDEIRARIVNSGGLSGPREFVVGAGAVANAQPSILVDPNGNFEIFYTQDNGVGGTVIVQASYEDLADAAPTGVVLDGFGPGDNAQVVENAYSGFVVGRLSAIDPDLNGSHTFTLVNNDGGRFALVGDEIRVANGVAIDFEQDAIQTIQVRVTDEAGLSVVRNINIDVLDQVRDLVDGTEVRDVVVGGAQNDRLFGLGGNDVLTGGAGNDVLDGGVGSDSLVGGAGNDYMSGGAGNDRYRIDSAGDRVVETAGGGTDAVNSSVTYTLGLNVENLCLIGGAAINATGNNAANIIKGNANANVLNGRGGNDTLTGGAGADVFLFNTALGATNVDTITDFSAAADTIHLDNAVFTALGAPGALSAAAFRDGTRALDADDRIIYDQLTGAVLYDADGSGAGAAVRFATLQTGLTLSEADFIIV